MKGDRKRMNGNITVSYGGIVADGKGRVRRQYVAKDDRGQLVDSDSNVKKLMRRVLFVAPVEVPKEIIVSVEAEVIPVAAVVEDDTEAREFTRVVLNSKKSTEIMIKRLAKKMGETAQAHLQQYYDCVIKLLENGDKAAVKKAVL